MIIAIISTLISSIALLGVAASLLLQARQLRASQLEASRAAQFEFIKLLLDRPELASSIFTDRFSPEGAALNWYIKYFEFAYSMKVISTDSIRLQLMEIFSADHLRNWWSAVREIYKTEAESAGKSEKDFFLIVDEAVQKIATQQHTSGNESNNIDNSANSS